MTYEIANDYSQQEGFEHQLSPVKGGRYVTVFHGPEGTDVGDLHCELEPIVTGDRPSTINHSGWKPSDEQVRQLESGAHVRLTVFQHPIPPLAVSVEEPVCACHEQPMLWDTDDGNYFCRHLTTSAASAPDLSPIEQARSDFEPQGEPGVEGG